MQQQWTVRSFEEFWQVIKRWRPREGAALERRYFHRKGARMTVRRLFEVLRRVDLRCNWASVQAFKDALLQRIRETGFKRAEVAKRAKLSPETIKNVLAGGHCPSVAPALLLAAFTDEHLPGREPLSLVITTEPATGMTSDAASPADAPQAGQAPADARPDSPRSGGTPGASDTQASARPESGWRQTPRPCDGLGRCRRRWAAARRQAHRTQAAARRSFASAAGQHPPDAAARAPVAAERMAQESPAVTADRTPSAVIRDRLSQESPSTFPRRTEIDDGLSQESPSTFPRRTEIEDRHDRRNSPTSTLVDRRRVPNTSPPMHVLKCRFPDGRVMTHEETSMAAVHSFLARNLAGDDLMNAQIQVDGRPFDAMGFIALQNSNQAKALAAQAEERAVKAEARAEELQRSRMPSIFEHLVHGAFEQLEYMHTKREQKQQKKEKRRHGRKR